MGKEIIFQSIHEEENIDKGKSSNDNINESIAMLTKQFSKVVKKFKNSNNYGSNSRDQGYYRRKDFDKPNVKDNGSFNCREYEGYSHYQVECLKFLRSQKKSLGATLSDEESNDSDGEGE